MWFQKISLPSQWKVTGNSKGMGVPDAKAFYRKVWRLTGISGKVGDSNQKVLVERGMDIFWNNTVTRNLIFRSCSLVSIFSFKSCICRFLRKCFPYGMVAACRQRYSSATQTSMNKASEFSICNTTQKPVMEKNRQCWQQGSLHIVVIYIHQKVFSPLICYWILQNV